MLKAAKLIKVVLAVSVVAILLAGSGSAVGKDKPKAKELIIAVDYGDSVGIANRKGELGDTPLIKQIMDDIKSAGADAVCWRVSCVGFVTYPSKVHKSYYPKTPANRVSNYDLLFKRCDPLRVAIDYAHEIGLKIYAYITLFDDSFELLETEFGHKNPQYYMRHHDWSDNCNYPDAYRIKGIFSYGYPEVRAWRMKLIKELISYGIAAARTQVSILFRSTVGIRVPLCLICTMGTTIMK